MDVVKFFVLRSSSLSSPRFIVYEEVIASRWRKLSNDPLRASLRSKLNKHSTSERLVLDFRYSRLRFIDGEILGGGRKNNLITLNAQWSVKRVIKRGNHKIFGTASVCGLSERAATGECGWLLMKNVLKFIIFYHLTLCSNNRRRERARNGRGGKVINF